MKYFSNTHFFKTLLVGFMIMFSSSCTEVKKREPEIYLIPEGYVGSVHIVFSAPNGKPEKYEGGSRVYDIPPSGVLVTQMDANEGWIEVSDIQYFSVNEAGRRLPINEATESTPKSARTVYVGSFGQAGPVYGCTIITQSLVIGTDSQQRDIANILTIFEAIKAKNIDKKLFEGMC